LIALTVAAKADILSGGPVYGGPTSVGGTIVCRLFNAGFFTATITSRQIWNNAGGFTAPTADSCSAGLGPQKSCEFDAPITANFAFSCRAFVSSTDEKVSGVAEIQAPTHAILNTIPMGK
jgi:hypothetical protein